MDSIGRQRRQGHGRHLGRWLSPVLLLAVLGVPVTDAKAEADTTPPAPFETGADAVAALGDQLDEVAATHRMTAAELTDELLSDDTLQVDAHDQLAYVEDAVVGPILAPPVTDPTGYFGTSTPTGLTDGQVFTLASRPTSTRTIYLDFTGHVTTGTYWNQSPYPTTITTPAYSKDADPATLTQDERDQIAKTWASVTESYAAFDVNVTTKDPGVEALRKTSSGDTAYGIRVVIGPNTWFDPSGGVAYLGSFTWGTDTPAFVFSDALQNAGKYMGDAATHEAGHSFGLHHDGTSTVSYYKGQGSWAPIMGVGYDKATVQWSSGEYSLANNTEDDVAIIKAIAPNVTDVEGAPGAPVPLGPLPASNGGVISTRTDVDVFSLSTAGDFTVNLGLRAPNPMLDPSITVKNSAGVVVASSDPAGAVGISLPYSGAAGSYTVEIDGVGYGTAASTGYSDYASLGGYWLTVTGTNPTAPDPEAPVAVPSASTTTAVAPAAIGFSAADSTDPAGRALTYNWTFGDGSSSTLPNPSKTYSNAGTYTVALTVTNDLSLSSTSMLAVTVLPNKPPVVGATSRVVAGYAPLAVQFSGTASKDPEGAPLKYLWTFGEGHSSTSSIPLFTYTVPGTYVATLTVTDSVGQTASKSITITVRAPVKATATFTLAKVTGTHAGTARVTVKDVNGKVVPNAAVTGHWSGIYVGGGTVKTNSLGQVVFTSPAVAKGGTLYFTVTKVAAPYGWTWDGVRRTRSILA